MIDANLTLIDASITQIESDLTWLRRLKAAIERGDVAGRVAILRERAVVS